MISLPASILSDYKTPYDTLRDKLLSFAIPYFRDCQVEKSTHRQSFVEFSTDEDDIRHPSTADHFHPDVWDGHHFGSSSTATDFESGKPTEVRLEEKKNEVKDILSLASSDPFQELDLVDKIQRLGIAYQFQVEIQEILNRTYSNDYSSYYDTSVENACADLHFVSLRFRLLRQAGYYVSPAVFNKFKDVNGQFSPNLVLDVLGMLSLYEASHLGFNGEDIMDAALTFSTNHLQSIASDLTSPLALQVQHALHTPLHHKVERVLAIEYIKIYGDDITRNKTLLEYAKLDYNFVQLLHQKEINQLSRWWKNIDINSKVPFHVRDRVVEAYACVSSCNFEPQFSLGRIHLTKVWCVQTILDDAHDVYGNLTELEPLCEALQRWENADLNELTDHMKEIFHQVSDLVKDIEGDIKKKGHFIGHSYLKKEFQVVNKAYFEEAKILFLKEPPKMENWFQLPLTSVGWNPCLVAAVINMGELATKEIFDWIDSTPTILKCTYLISRLIDEIGTNKLERARGVRNTYLTCYMKEHGVSLSEAKENFRRICMRLWKDINQECLRINNPAPLGLHKIILGFTRTMVLYYGDDDDGFTNSSGRTKELITSILVKPFPIEEIM